MVAHTLPSPPPRRRHHVARVKIGDLAFAVGVAVVVGGGAGLAVGFAARQFGWPTGFVGPLTGGIVSAMTMSLYHMRAGSVAKGSA